MHLLNPAWLFAIAAIAIPLVIHLWNIKPGRVLKVGSISLFNEASRKSSRSLKFTDLLLLLLRCLLLLLVAFLLASPFIEQHLKAGKQKGWVLLPREELHRGYSLNKKTIDSLLKLGFEFHYFNDSLPKADTASLYASLKGNADQTKNDADYWSLLQQLDRHAAEDVPVYLFTADNINYFKGDRPQVSLNLKWQTFNGADTTASWLQSAWLTAGKDIHVIKGSSNTKGVHFVYSNISTVKSNGQFKIDVVDGRPFVGLLNTGKTLAVDTGSLKIAVYTKRYYTDARYLKAALDAACKFAGRPTAIKQYSNAAAVPAGQTWVFWLSDEDMPARLLNKSSNIVTYSNGKLQNTATFLRTAGAYALPSAEDQPAIFKTITTNKTYPNVIWQDGFGKPLLVSENRGKANVYTLFSRFSPAWGDLVWSSRFPQLILQLVYTGPSADLSLYDKRTLPVNMLLPLQGEAKHVSPDKLTVTKPLSNYFWLVLIIVFFAERWLATTQKTQANG